MPPVAPDALSVLFAGTFSNSFQLRNSRFHFWTCLHGPHLKPTSCVIGLRVHRSWVLKTLGYPVSTSCIEFPASFAHLPTQLLYSVQGFAGIALGTPLYRSRIKQRSTILVSARVDFCEHDPPFLSASVQPIELSSSSALLQRSNDCFYRHDSLLKLQILIQQ